MLLVAAAALSADAPALQADVSEAQKRFYIGLANSWIRRNASGVSSYFDSRVTLDLGPHCRPGKYKRRQAIGVLATHLGRHVLPDPRQSKIIKMTSGYMILRHHYKDLVTGQRKQQNLWFMIRRGRGFIVTQIHP